jgi:hypothetical protein
LVRADGNKRSSVAGTARDSEGLKYFAVALDLVRKPSDVVIDDDRLRDVAPEQGPPMTETLMAYPLHEPPAGGSRKKKPKFRNSAITRHAVKLTLVMVSTAVGAGLGALLVSVGVVSVTTAVVGYTGVQSSTKCGTPSKKNCLIV